MSIVIAQRKVVDLPEQVAAHPVEDILCDQRHRVALVGLRAPRDEQGHQEGD